jgi:heme O synthase-like polyprenyltransferase
MSAPVSPKVTASSLTALIVVAVVTFIVQHVPVLVGHSDLIALVVTAVVGAGAAWLAGYYRKAVVWAEKYVQEHRSFPSSR